MRASVKGETGARIDGRVATRVVEARRAYGLTIDRREAAALDRILAACDSTALDPVVCAVPSASARVPARATATLKPET